MPKDSFKTRLEIAKNKAYKEENSKKMINPPQTLEQHLN